MRARPPAGCSTFAREDFSRVPFPAARITITTSLFGIVRLFSPALPSLTIAGREFAEYLLTARNPAGAWGASRRELRDGRKYGFALHSARGVQVLSCRA